MGHDRAAIDVVENDEVKDFLNARYVGPPEACWRLLSFDMHGKSQVVDRSLAFYCLSLSPYIAKLSNCWLRHMYALMQLRANRVDRIVRLLNVFFVFVRA